MTREEAIHLLVNATYSEEWQGNENLQTAQNMAIKALEQEQTRDEKLIDAIDFAIEATGSQDDYCMGMRNGMRYVKSLIDGKEPQYESMWNLGDEVIGDSGTKGVVVGIDIYKGEVRLSLLMKGYKVPQLVKASRYKTKTGRHFPQIIEVLEQIEGDERWKIDLS